MEHACILVYAGTARNEQGATHRGGVETGSAGRRQVGSHALHGHDVGVVGSKGAAAGDVGAARMHALLKSR